MKTLREKQEDYARLLLAEGLNLQKGQLLAIDCPVDEAWFARLCALAAYDMGCREVVMNWSDDALAREKYLRAADEVFDSVHSWTADFYEKVSAEGGRIILCVLRQVALLSRFFDLFSDFFSFHHFQILKFILECL